MLPLADGRGYRNRRSSFCETCKTGCCDCLRSVHARKGDLVDTLQGAFGVVVHKNFGNGKNACSSMRGECSDNDVCCVRIDKGGVEATAG